MKNIFLYLFIIVSVAAMGQVPTDQDCLGAIPVCQDIYVQPNSYSGQGNYPNEIPTGGGCPGNCMNDGEKNDVWYIFTVQTGGLLGFTITPVAMSNDYDWAVYSLNQFKCQDIYSHVGAMQKSCNWSGTAGVTGPNGNSSLNCQGASGSPYNAKIPVLPGETYVINISNYSSTQSGYTLDFSTSTAQIYDDVAPEIESIESGDIICGTNTLDFEFTEKVKCNTVSPGKFKITGPGGPYEVLSVYGDDCLLGGQMEKSFHLTFTPAIYENGEYALEVRPLSFIQDACGNNASAQSYPFDVDLNSPIASAGPDIDIAYSGSTVLDGSASGGSGNFSYAWTPVAKLVDPSVEDPTTINLINSSAFYVTVTDNNTNCVGSDDMMVNIVGGPMSVDALASPTAVCAGDQTDLNTNITGGSGSFTYSWTSDPAGFVSNISNPSDNPLVTTTYYVEVNDGFTVITAQVTVSVHPNPNVDAGVDQVINVGTITTLDGGATNGQEPYDYLWEPSIMLDGPNDIYNPQTIILTDPQNYTLFVVDGNGCPGEPDVMLVNVAGDALSAFPQSDPQEICIGGSATLFSNAVGGGGNYTYTWTNPDDPLWSATGADVEVSPETTTSYHVEVSDGFTIVTEHVILPVHPLPVIDLIPIGIPENGQDTITVCVRDTVVLDAGNQSNPPEMQYMWSNGLSDRYLTAKTNGNWIDFQSYSVDVTNVLTTCANSAEITIVFDFNQCEIGVEENIVLEHPVKIHPNPNTGIFTIETDEAIQKLEIQLTNLHGMIIFERNYKHLPANGWDDVVDLSSQSKGVYLLHMNVDGNIFTQKVVVK